MPKKINFTLHLYVSHNTIILYGDMSLKIGFIYIISKYLIVKV